MAATITKEFLYEQMEKRNTPFWVVTDGREEIANNMEAADIDESKEILDNVFSNIMDAFVMVKIYERPKGKIAQGGNTRAQSMEYKIQLRSPGQMRGVGGFGNNGLVDQLMQENKQLQNKVHEKDLELIKSDFQKQIDELKEKKSDPMEAAILAGITGMFGKQQTASTLGDPAETIDQNQVERQKKIRASLIRLAKVDPNIDTTLTQLADFAEKSPEKYKSFLPMLKAMA